MKYPSSNTTFWRARFFRCVEVAEPPSSSGVRRTTANPTRELASSFSMMVWPRLGCSCRMIGVRPRSCTKRATISFAAWSCPWTMKTVPCSAGTGMSPDSVDSTLPGAPASSISCRNRFSLRASWSLGGVGAVPGILGADVAISAKTRSASSRSRRTALSAASVAFNESVPEACSTEIHRLPIWAATALISLAADCSRK